MKHSVDPLAVFYEQVMAVHSKRKRLRHQTIFADQAVLLLWGPPNLYEKNWNSPGCRALTRLDTEIRRRGVFQSYETRYFVTSLDPDAVSVSEFQDLISRHWAVSEKKLADPRQTDKKLGFMP